MKVPTFQRHPSDYDPSVARFVDPPYGAGVLLEQPIAEILELLGSGELDSPAGSTAALCAAFAAALTAAIARQMDATVAEGAVAQADALRARLCRLAQATGVVHRRAVRLLELAEMGPVQDEESGLRNKELASALREAAEFPLQICETAADVVSLAGWVADDGPAATRADAIAAACTAEAAVSSAAALVEANLTVQAGDEHAERARAHARASQATRRSLQASDDQL